jgi:hypothetical protein
MRLFLKQWPNAVHAPSCNRDTTTPCWICFFVKKWKRETNWWLERLMTTALSCRRAAYTGTYMCLAYILS